jgi:hypothetical protein
MAILLCFALLKLTLMSLGISSGCIPQKFIGLEVGWWGKARLLMLGKIIPVMVGLSYTRIKVR